MGLGWGAAARYPIAEPSISSHERRPLAFRNAESGQWRSFVDMCRRGRNWRLMRDETDALGKRGIFSGQEANPKPRFAVSLCQRNVQGKHGL